MLTKYPQDIASICSDPTRVFIVEIVGQENNKKQFYSDPEYMFPQNAEGGGLSVLTSLLFRRYVGDYRRSFPP